MKKIVSLIFCFWFSMYQTTSAAFIEDDFAKESLRDVPRYEYRPLNIKDDFALRSLRVENNTDYKKNIKTDFENEYGATVKLRTLTNIASNADVFEGASVYFATVNELRLNNGEIIPKNTKVRARVETISESGIRGIPADLIVGNFEIPSYNIKLKGIIAKTGANRSLWVYPASTLGTMFFGLGVLFVFIKGGHARLSPNKIYEVQYASK